MNLTIVSSGADVWGRGHGPKIWEGMQAAAALGLLPDNLRPMEFGRIVLNQLVGRGYAECDLPSQTALYKRYAALYRSQ